MTHTPTPWEQGGYLNLGIYNGAKEIAQCYWGRGVGSKQAKDNAAHIVKCVNMHDELVVIAMTAFKMIDDPVHWSVANPHAGGFDEDKLKETLKKAGAL